MKITYQEALKCNLAVQHTQDGQVDLSELYDKIDATPGPLNKSVTDILPYIKGEKSKTEITTFVSQISTEANGTAKDDLKAAFPTLLLLRPFQTWRMAR